MTYSKWIALELKETLRTWKGPETLDEAYAACCLVSICKDEVSEKRREHIRHLISHRIWDKLPNCSSNNLEGDLISWYLIIGPNDDQHIVEMESPYNYMRKGIAANIWRVSVTDTEALKNIGSELFLLQAPKSRIGKFLSYLGRLWFSVAA